MGVLWVDSTGRADISMSGEISASNGKDEEDDVACTELGMISHRGRSTYRCIGMFGPIKATIPSADQIAQGAVPDTYWLAADFVIRSGGTLTLSTDTRLGN